MDLDPDVDPGSGAVVGVPGAGGAAAEGVDDDAPAYGSVVVSSSRAGRGSIRDRAG
ncbi:hypothetical protein GCM10009753_69930 [Streptantibioticus ferralitis]